MSSQPPQRPPRQRRDRKDTRSAAMSQRDRDRMRTTPKEMKPTIRRMLRSVIRSQQDYTSVPEELGCANCLSGGVPCYVYAIHAVAVFSSKLHGKRTPVYGLCQTCKFRGLNCPFSKNIPPHQPRARQPQPPRTGKTQTKEEKKQRQKELLASQHPSKQAWEKKTDKWLSKSMSPQEGATRPNVSESAAVVEAGLVRSDADTGSASERNAEAAVLESVARGSADLASPPDAVNNNHSPQEDDDDDLEEVVW
ncbi:hypothetical protein CC85DRAFT_291287 [Cutaneotrichosporon oleaginosum]|uniref:Uncharacterized protein n=1 Tax=Cutaneotrichosporon oleaginosum TaxID=879819 RepID=A0A0J1B7X8_9TREE|nr:uncharacterized protein CC85DRAFT_291287 [Cutaneotrichosporon oleaginosum]KLT43879.1 hypothetical protein CC85DRAFT_291287 [Cutaneotrichosporon oleaginosum]TXT06381.1 hypothetical protein COLE_05712 [Cutaneotrichosporon oleaginosum]